MIEKRKGKVTKRTPLHEIWARREFGGRVSNGNDREMRMEREGERERKKKRKSERYEEKEEKQKQNAAEPSP